MYIQDLIIKNNETVVRHIEFKKGLNLIVDESTNAKSVDSGNNVGKTTLLRLIDYCLGADPLTIYKDKEFNKVNKKTKAFIENDAIIQMTLLNDEGDSYTIERAFNKSALINNKKYTAPEFLAELKRLIWGLDTQRPTTRQLTNKFIRIESYQLEKTVRFLHPSTAFVEYDYLFLFLFGEINPDIITKKINASNIVKDLENQQKTLKQVYSPEAAEQLVAILDEQIKDTEAALSSFQFEIGVQSEITALNEIREEVVELSLKIAKLNIQIQYYQKSLADIKGAEQTIDLVLLRNLYNQANAYLPNLHKDFDSLVAFHNEMLRSKLKFITNNLDNAILRKKDLQSKMTLIMEQEQTVLSKVSKTGPLENYRKTQMLLTKLKEDRVEHTVFLKKSKELEKELEECRANLQTHIDELVSTEEKVKRNLMDFNKYFYEYSNQLYNEKFIFSIEFLAKNNKKKHLLNLQIDSIDANQGAGKKKVQVAAFDLAYMKYKENSQCLHVVAHDRLELISINQIKTLFDIANTLNGQYIVPILKDKLSSLDKDFIERNTILSLSQEDKLFRLESDISNSN